MQCSCGQRKWSVTSTRPGAGCIDRTRVCQSCGERYQTTEQLRDTLHKIDATEGQRVKRLKRPAADELRSRIDSGELAATLETALMTDGSCKRFEPKPASESTCAKPGSLEKIEVLRQRVAAGESLWHELDDRSPTLPPARLEPYQPGIREFELLEVA